MAGHHRWPIVHSFSITTAPLTLTAPSEVFRPHDLDHTHFLFALESHCSASRCIRRAPRTTVATKPNHSIATVRMVKRKRSRESDLDQKLAEARKEIFRALKGAKGLERQRYSKRMRDDKSTPDKLKRLEREVLVLKVNQHHQAGSLPHFIEGVR